MPKPIVIEIKRLQSVMTAGLRGLIWGSGNKIQGGAGG